MDTVTSSSTTRGRRERYDVGGAAQFGNAARPAPQRPAPARPGPRPASTEPDFEAIRNSAEFIALRRRLRGFIFPMGVIFLAWYFGYVLLSAYLPEFMSEKVFGDVNVGIVLGLLQFVSTAAFTVLYVRFARKRIDPSVARIRAQARVGQQ